MSGNELLELTGAEDRTNINRVYGLVYGALDFIAILFLFLPLFGKADGGYIRAVSLLGAPDLSHGVQAVFYAAFLSMSLLGAVELILQQIGKEKGSSVCNACSVGFHVILVLVFSISRQPYATALLFALLMVKGVFALKKTNRL